MLMDARKEDTVTFDYCHSVFPKAERSTRTGNTKVSRNPKSRASHVSPTESAHRLGQEDGDSHVISNSIIAANKCHDCPCYTPG